MIQSVLVGTDGSERAQCAVSAAVDVAKGQDATLLIVAAFRDEDTHWETISGSAAVAVGNLSEAAEQVLMRSARHAEERGVKQVDWEARGGHPADVILDIAAERSIDLIVVGNKGMTGAKRFLLGSVPNKVSHHAPCSVLIIRTTG